MATQKVILIVYFRDILVSEFIILSSFLWSLKNLVLNWYSLKWLLSALCCAFLCSNIIFTFIPCPLMPFTLIILLFLSIKIFNKILLLSCHLFSSSMCKSIRLQYSRAWTDLIDSLIYCLPNQDNHYKKNGVFVCFGFWFLFFYFSCIV